MINYARLLFLAPLLLASLISTPLSAQPAPQPQVAAPRPGAGNQIRQIKGDLYRASNGGWHSIFLVTP
ncbi:MAG: hypothetical protein WCI66_12465, partial [Gammaproteobacteria bacterium]